MDMAIRASTTPSHPVPAQVSFWNRWNADTREERVDKVSIEQARTVTAWFESFRRTDLDIIDIGCGTGWLCEQLQPFGRVTGTDLADEVLKRSAQRLPKAKFIAGDFMALDLEREAFDFAVSLEVLSHVADQPAFMAKIASLLRPGGYLIMATQNRPALERNILPPPGPGQIRRWVDRKEFETLLRADFDILELISITPQFNTGPLRYVNSRKFAALLGKAGLGGLHRRIVDYQEKSWLGWSLMTLARKRAACLNEIGSTVE